MDDPLFRCSSCKTHLPTSAYGTKSRTRGGTRPVPYNCRRCANRLAKQNYRENAARYKGTAKARHDEMRRRLSALKQAPCADCGVSYPPYVMDWDHCPSESKVSGIAAMFRRKFRWETIMMEIAKCELVCANCHRMRTHSRMATAGKVDANEI